MKSLDELGREYLAEADRLDGEAVKLKKNRPEGSETLLLRWRNKILALEGIATETRITGRQLIAYYEEDGQ